MKKRRTILKIIFSMLLVVNLSSCGIISNSIDLAKNIIDDSVEDAYRELDYIPKYDKSFVSLYDRSQSEKSEMLNNFGLAFEVSLCSYIDSNSAVGSTTTYNDNLGNTLEVQQYTAVDTSNTGVYTIALITLTNSYYRDGLDAILKDTKSLIDEYRSSSDGLLLVASDSDGQPLWYSIVNFITDSTKAFDFTGEYVNYLAYVDSSVSIENSDYYYTCNFSNDIYNIDLLSELGSDDKFTFKDSQIYNISLLDKDTYDTIEYNAYQYDCGYIVNYQYDEEDASKIVALKLKVYSNDSTLNVYDIDTSNISLFFLDVYNSAKNAYDSVTISFTEGQDGSEVYKTKDGNVIMNLID